PVRRTRPGRNGRRRRSIIFSNQIPTSTDESANRAYFSRKFFGTMAWKSGIMKMAASSLRAHSSEAAVADHAKTELLVRLLIRHQDELFRYIYALLPHQEDARD